MPTPCLRSALTSVTGMLGRPIAVCASLLLIVGGLLHPLGPADAALRMDTGSLHAPIWRKVYNDLPASWRSDKPIRVEEITDLAMAQLTAEGDSGRNGHGDAESVVDGCFRQSDDRDDSPIITLRESLRGEDAELVFAHEYSHFIWDEKLTDTQRRSYTALWRAQKRAGHLVTRYAADSVEEGFAEAASFFLRRPSVLRSRDPASGRFLTGVLRAEMPAPPAPAPG